MTTNTGPGVPGTTIVQTLDWRYSILRVITATLMVLAGGFKSEQAILNFFENAPLAVIDLPVPSGKAIRFLRIIF